MRVRRPNRRRRIADRRLARRYARSVGVERQLVEEEEDETLRRRRASPELFGLSRWED
jgi:hypothetical protein